MNCQPKWHIPWGLTVAGISSLVAALPVAWFVASAFRPESDILSAPFTVPRRWTTDNFATLSQLPGFWRNAANSVLVAATTTMIVVTWSLIIAYVLTRCRFPGRSIIIIALSLGYLLAPVIIVLPYFKMLSRLGLTNSLAGLTIAHVSFCMPLAVALASIIVKSTPIEVEEFGHACGCTPMRRIIHIVCASSRPLVIAMLVLVFIISWKEFFFAFTLSPAQSSRTLPVLLAETSSGDSVQWGAACALGAVLALPIVALPWLWLRLGRAGESAYAGMRG